MKRMTRDEKVFQQLRQLPTELSRTQVNDIIALLPNLPPPSSGWFSSFSLNSILMSTIIISTLSVLSFLFLNPTPTPEIATTALPIEVEEKKKIPSPEVEKKTVTKPNKKKTKNNTQLSINQAVTKNDTIIPNRIKSVESSPDILTNKQEKLTLTESAIPPIELEENDLLALSPEQPEPSLVKDKSSIFEQKKQKLFPTSVPQKINPNWGPPICVLQINFHNKFNVFKNRLLRHLERDELIRSSKRLMRCYYTSSAIIVNDKLLSGELEQKYRDFFSEYDLAPCDQRVIETTPDYIAIGDMSNEGFKGAITGKVDLGNMNLIPRSPLLSPIKTLGMQKEIRPLSAFHTLKTDGLAVVYLTDKDYNQARLEVAGMPITDVITKEKNGVLTITTKGKHNGESIKVYVSSEQIKNIEVSGASQLIPETTIKSNQLSIKTLDNGSAWVKVEVNELIITMQGGDLNIDGSANTRQLIDLDSERRGTLQEADLKINNRVNEGLSMTSCFELLEVSEYDLGRLQEELRDMIIKLGDDVKNINFPVQITMKEQQIQINNQKLNLSQSEDFFDLLKQYDIRICEDRLIAVGKRFIAMGDVAEEGFRGTALGKKVLLQSRYGKIELSIGEGYKIFNTIGWGSKF